MLGELTLHSLFLKPQKHGSRMFLTFSLINNSAMSIYILIKMCFQAPGSVPHVRPETPRQLTHTHDEDCSDEEDVSKAQNK